MTIPLHRGCDLKIPRWTCGRRLPHHPPLQQLKLEFSCRTWKPVSNVCSLLQILVHCATQLPSVLIASLLPSGCAGNFRQSAHRDTLSARAKVLLNRLFARPLQVRRDFVHKTKWKNKQPTSQATAKTKIYPCDLRATTAAGFRSVSKHVISSPGV